MSFPLLSLRQLAGDGEINQLVEIYWFAFKLTAEKRILQSLFGSDAVSGGIGNHETINVIDRAGLDVAQIPSNDRFGLNWILGHKINGSEHPSDDLPSLVAVLLNFFAARAEASEERF